MPFFKALDRFILLMTIMPGKLSKFISKIKHGRHRWRTEHNKEASRRQGLRVELIQEKGKHTS